MSTPSKQIITFSPAPFKKNTVYSLHKALKKNQEYYAKILALSTLDEYELNDVIDFNISALEETVEYIYPDSFLYIEDARQQNQSIVLLTKKYEARLDEYLLTAGPRPEKQALIIFQDILKAVYSLVMNGYWHRNLRAEHFVKIGDHWKL